MVAILVGFIPFLAYAALRGAGQPEMAVLVGLVSAAALNGARWRRRNFKAPEVVTLAYFAVLALLFAGPGPGAVARYEGLAVFVVLALMAWGTLLAGSPFTFQYARDNWPRAFWDLPEFRRVNALITALWGAVFTVGAGIHAAWVLGVIPPAAMGWGTGLAVGLGSLCSVVLPRWLPRVLAARQLRAQNPYDWPAPDFAAGPRPDGDAYDVVVVGAGVGGLTAGALLARRGLRVLVAEQHTRAGGFCTTWVRNIPVGGRRLRFEFDAGVHDISGLGPRGPVRNLLRQLDAEDAIDWRHMAHTYQFGNHRLAVPRRAGDFVARLAAEFPDQKAGLEAFFAEMEQVYRDLYADVQATGGVPVPPRTVDDMLAYPRDHPAAARWMQRPFSEMLDTFLDDAGLKAVLSSLSGYLADDAGALTVGQMAPIFGYYFDGGFYPTGGSQVFADLLVGTIKAHGGKVLIRKAVRRIRQSGGAVAGVELANGAVHPCRAVVGNADPRLVFGDLVDGTALPADFAAALAGARSSTSAFVVDLGVSMVPDVTPLTFLRTDDGAGLGIAVPSLVSPGLAPEGHAVVHLIRLVPADLATWDRDDPGYRARKAAFGDAMIDLAETAIPGLRRHIVLREDGTPATFRHFAWAPDGAIYGLGQGGWRPPAKSPLRGLVLAGAGVFPGAGVEAAVISGTIAADTLYPRPA
ncbi:MAG: NAD(P)/FAD-dependent oxidoreductase [Hyphomicrobiales bacterium]|nr:NAD(P)/FAD-dependent oxidoreductase [Hyphomicrobiales bacterium]MCP5372393.1 NAD(P)/FAD-dependent oxidoreductase [Hyphomicrobiales bacterium]